MEEATIARDYTWPVKITTFDAGQDQRLTPAGQLRLQQEIGELHMSTGGLGYQVLCDAGMAFLLTRTNSVVHRAPALNEEVALRTWHRGTRGAQFYRCYEFLDKAGEKLIESVTAFALVDVRDHRLLRPASELPAGSVVLQTAAQAAAYLAGKPGNILLATGAKELPAFAPLDPARLYPRVLPTLAGITACETAGIPHRNIIAMQGPFTRELNVAVMHQFHIAYMVTKDGGAAGGFAEKAQAAAQCGVQLIVLCRPEEQGETAETILQRCRELL